MVVMSVTSASRRLKIINGHLREVDGKNCDKTNADNNERYGVIPKERHKLLKWNGWGFEDSKFEIATDPPRAYFTGSRYGIAGKELPKLIKWVEDKLNVTGSNILEPQPLPSANSLPQSKITADFVKQLTEKSISFTTNALERLCRSHGQSYQDIYPLYHGTDHSKKRIPDIIAWPKHHDDVETIVELCKKNNIVIIPVGGATSVANHLDCPVEDARPILSLDLTQMNRILWIDEENLVACAEAGITGITLEHELGKYGYCSGHEPDSQEFSTLGGWISTRASGMKKSVYGNIEDLLVHVKLVTTEGVVQKSCLVPRISCGPDIHQVILGSEGMLGVITEAVIKVRPKPEVIRYGSILFPCFEDGVRCLREVARQRLKPASIRLLDNEQFLFGMSLKPAVASSFKATIDTLKKLYVTKMKGFDEKKMCVTTLLFEGTKQEVDSLESKIHQIANNFGGLSAGEESGQQGYTLTFVIAYLRDCAIKLGVASESFETAVPWDRVIDLCSNVKKRLVSECSKHGIKHPPLATCRVTQSYDCGACVYFYLAFNNEGIDDPVKVFHDVEMEARNEILANGGSISHHHGIGKARKKWVKQTISSPGLQALHAVKQQLDPLNIFAANNFL